MSRCRNCGDESHETKWCKEYGPWFPDPLKQRSDYAEQAAEIDRLVAGDILKEHEESHGHADHAGSEAAGS